MEENRKANLPKNSEEKQYWAQHTLDEEKKASQAMEEGRDYNVSTARVMTFLRLMDSVHMN